MQHPDAEAMVKLAQIAQNILGFETPEDVNDIHVAEAERALIAAYQVGVQAAVDEMKALMKEEGQAVAGRLDRRYERPQSFRTMGTYLPGHQRRL